MFGLFKTIGRIYHIISILVLVILIYAGMLVYTVGHTKIESVQVSGVSNITIDGFTLEGDVTIRNGGSITLNVKEITYAIMSENVTLVNGTIEGGKVKPGENVTFHYAKAIPWTRDLAMGLDLAQGAATNVDVEGEVVLSHFGIYKTRIPFKNTFNIAHYLTDLAKEKAPGFSGVIDVVAKGVDLVS